MRPNAFIGQTKPPTEPELARALGVVKPHWDSIVVDLARELDLDNREWKSYGVKHGWALRLRRGKRNIVHLSPCQKCVAVLFILGDRAVAAARASRLSRAAVKLFDEAPRFPEGTGIRLEVTGPKHLPLIRKLAKIKLEN